MMDYYDSQVKYVKRNAARFGYDLDEVFNKEKGKHHPKMNEIYSNKNFDFMQEWYKGNMDLEKLHDKLKDLEAKIDGKENPTQSDLNRLEKLTTKFMNERRAFVNDMLELD
jgi:predicted  nucleic acid-binding Zn-ribbon protein